SPIKFPWKVSILKRREWLEKYKREMLDRPARSAASPEKLQDYLLRMMGFVEESSIVADFGCGVCNLWPLLRDMGMRIVGVSCNRKEQQQKGIRIMNIEMTDFNLLGIFEGFVAVDLLQRIPPELWSKILLKISRSIKTDGVGLIVTELSEEKSARSFFSDLKGDGLPVVVGENLEDGEYSFRPLKSWYDQWLKNAGLSAFREEVIDSVVYSIVRK
ncbi:MAG TPA: hypothetical protein PKU79_00800, partial [Mesotoga sp.]|nr:hypothetical protein [Mesotoga sp.]